MSDPLDDPLAQPGVCVRLGHLLALGALVRQAGPPRPGIRRAPAGSHGVRRHGQGLEPQEIRPWSEGDEARRIDRNATARRGEPQVRLLRDEIDRRVLLVADFRPSMVFGTRGAFRSVAAAEALALVGWRRARAGARIDALVLTGAGVEPVRGGAGEAGLRPVLARIADAHEAALRRPPEDGPTLAACLAPVDARGEVVLATALDEPGDGLEGILARLGARNGLEALLIRDPFETGPPPGRYPYRRGPVRRVADVRGAGPRPEDGRLALLARAGIPAAILATDLSPLDRLAILEGAAGG